jgi:2-hydroxychromene-2-carboxylate isomerase
VRFFFDYISPNAYIAWKRIHAVVERHDHALEPVPVLFAGLLRANRLLGPAEVPDKRRWMFKDVLRKAHVLGLPLRPPAAHPFNPLLALRVTSLPLSPDLRRRLIDTLFAAVWERGLDVSRPATVVALVGSLGLDGARAVANAGTPGTKDRLRRATEAALREGVFGVPTMIVGQELFWGFDDFKHLELVLAGDDPIEPEELKAWDEIRPSAWRAEAGEPPPPSED